MQCREAAEPPSHVTFPAECYARQDMPVFNSLAPRLHAAYDVSGDAGTVLKGGYARYTTCAARTTCRLRT